MVDVNSIIFAKVSEQIAQFISLMQQGDKCYYYHPEKFTAHDKAGALATVGMIKYRKIDVGEGVCHAMCVLAEEFNRSELMIFAILDNPSRSKTNGILSAMNKDAINHLDTNFVVCTINPESNQDFEKISMDYPQYRYVNVTNTQNMASVLMEQIHAFVKGYEYFKLWDQNIEKPEEVIEKVEPEEFVVTGEIDG